MHKKNIRHPFPIWGNDESKILILGTFPSNKSEENNYYYANKRNTFWSLVQKNLGTNEIFKSAKNVEQYCLDHHIALYDVIESCSVRTNKKGKRSSNDNDLEINVSENITYYFRIITLFDSQELYYETFNY